MSLFRWLKNNSGRAKGFSGCLRCEDTWNWKDYHITNYSNTSGCFPLCEECWQICNRADIIRYYGALVHIWRQDGSWFSFEDEQYLVNAALDEKGFEANWEGPINNIMRARS